MDKSDKPRKNAFAVLLQASPTVNTAPTKDRNKKRRLTDSGESTLSVCPVCEGTIPTAFLEQHVEGCLLKSTERERKSSGTVVPKPEANSEHEIAATQQAEEPTKQLQSNPEAPEGEQDSNAFSRLMQRQLSHSRIHNFYLEQLPGQSFRWHWYLTSGGQDSKMLAHLAGNQAAAKDPEFAKGSVNPQVKQTYGGQPPSALPRAEQRAGEGQQGRSDGDKSGAAVLLGKLENQESGNTRAPLKAQPTRPGANEANSSDSPQEPGSEAESWKSLPPVQWHGMTQMLASKIGGPPKLKISVRLLTNLAPGDGGGVSWDTPDLESNRGAGHKFHGSISILKSAMQKNVRLCRPESAVRCGMHILKEDASELLRRCAIICLEDSVLHPALPIIVWSMAAISKGYVLGRILLTKCLAVLYHLAHSPVKDTLHLEAARKYKPSLDLFEQGKGLVGEQLVLVRVILLRAAFGGMAGDVQLLRGFAQMWSDRFCGFEAFEAGQKPAEASQSWQTFLWNNVKASHDCLNDQGEAYCLERVGPVTKQDIPASAVDFHASSIVEELLNNHDIVNKAKEINKDAAHLLRESMWKFRSGLSNKQKKFEIANRAKHDYSEENLRSFWQVASPIVEAWAEDFITKRFY